MGPPNLILLALLFLVAVITGCTGIGPRVIDLMPAPEAFAGRLFNPLPQNPPPVPYDDFNVLYATDRKASENPDQRPFYLNETGFIVRLGSARVTAGQPGLSWKDIRRISLSTQRTGNYPMKIQSVDETGVLDKTYTLLTREPEDSVIADRAGDEFAARVEERLTGSGVKEVYLYVHGFRVIFDDPVLIAAELWHFLGYRGAFIAYAWPSTPRATAYLSDLETAQTVARNLRLFLAYLSERTQVEKIHIVAFSAGSRLVVRALEQMALLNSGATNEQIRRNFRIGNLIIIGGDISRERFGAAVTDGM